MRMLKLIVTGLASLVVLAITVPLLAALRADRRERVAVDAASEYPYDDNDPGIDVDEPHVYDAEWWTDDAGGEA